MLNPTQLKVLRASSKKELPARLSVRDAMLALAKLGGHLKRNGDPGVGSLWVAVTNASSTTNKRGGSHDAGILIIKN